MNRLGLSPQLMAWISGAALLLDGKAPPRAEPVRRPQVRAGRNDRCPCGSGKKFKRCCRAVAPGAMEGPREIVPGG